MRILLVLISLWFVPVFAVAANENQGSDAAMEYLEMQPKLTINLAEPKKYLLINVQLMVEGAEAIELVKKNIPALRNALIMLYSGLSVTELQTMEQHEALRIKSKEEIRMTLERFAASEGFKDVFFTEFFVN
ncbi:MAG: flagellar basal body-associated FliL family protein [Methylococcaceae bacterium]|nr:flagellar basal body-associated FliL family protein [Methylococcaceae bacterium]